MTDRVIVYTNQVPYETDVLSTNLYAGTGISKLAEAILGTGTQVTGLACTPTTPSATLSVNVAPGQIYMLADVDATDYGVIPSDDTQILKQGLTGEELQNFPTPAPAGGGNSVIYLIQATFSESDEGDVSRPYFNSADPRDPIFTTMPDVRQDQCVLGIIAGSPAPSPVAPAPTAGWVGLWQITVANGQSSVTSGNITMYPGAPFIPGTVGDFLTEPQADARYAQFGAVQNNTYTAFADSGATNVMVVTPTPVLSSYQAGQSLIVKANHTNTIAGATLNANGLGAAVILRPDLSALQVGDIVIGSEQTYIHNGTNWVLQNPATNLSSLVAATTYLPLLASVASVTMSAPLIVATSATAKVTFNTVEYDTASLFNVGATRFQPLVAGYYKITSILLAQPGSTLTAQSTLTLRKNGSDYKRLSQMPWTDPVGDMTLSGSVIAVVNTPNSDYFEIYATGGTGGNTTFGTGGSVYATFQIEFLGT